MDFITPIITTIVIAAASAAIQSSMTKMPGAPDLTAASRAGIEAETATLADRRRMEAAAQQGTNAGTPARVENQEFVTITRQKTPLELQQEREAYIRQNGTAWLNRYNPQTTVTDTVRYNPSDFMEGGKYYGIYEEGPHETRQVTIQGQDGADFTGFGEADVQGRIATQMAQNQIDLSNKYGTQFIDEARKQLELSDPEGTQARRMAYDLMQEQIGKTPDRPVADMLDSQIGAELDAGNRLDGVTSSVLDDAVAQSRANRGGNQGGDFRSQFETGFAGANRMDAAQQKAASWLTSGATPEDVQYRREQQNMANLGAFTAGQSPVTQFQSLSGAQRGATPTMNGNPLPGANQNAGPAAQQVGLQTWATQQQNALEQANPWMAGLSAILQGVGSYKKAGN